MSVNLAASYPAQVMAQTVSQKSWHELTDWTHAWDMADATTYVPGAAEQADWGIDSSPRVAAVRDRGRAAMPLLRDTGPWGDIGILVFPPIPGPLYVPKDYRFAGRPSFFADPLIAGGHNLHSLLTPVADMYDPATFFAAPDGYSPPYWVAVLAHPPVGEVSLDGNPSLAAVMDSFRGDYGAGPTIGGTLTGKKWGVACFGGLPPSFLWPGIDHPYTAETVLAIVFVGAGINGSWMEVNWREHGKLQTLRETITLGSKDPEGAPFPFEETFFGYAETMRNSAIAIKLGVPTDAEVDDVRAWAAPFITEN